MHAFSRAGIIDVEPQIVQTDQFVESKQRLLGTDGGNPGIPAGNHQAEIARCAGTDADIAAVGDA